MEEGTKEDEVEEEEDEGKGTDLQWLRGGVAGGYRLRNGWSFFFFFAYFLCASPLYFCFLLLFLEVLLSTGRTVAASGC